MRFRPLVVACTLGSVGLLALACSSTKHPNLLLTFSEGQEDDTFDGVVKFDVKSTVATDGTTQGKVKTLLDAKKLPESLDLGDTKEYYQYVGTGYDADGNRVAVGRTLTVNPNYLFGVEIPMFFARTDRATRPSGGFAVAPKQNPAAAILSGSHVWLFDDSSDDNLETDAYNISYWEHFTPPSQYQSIPCPKRPCNLTNVAIVGGVLAIAISTDWARAINAGESYSVEYELPEGLSKWSEVAGGRVVPGGNATALLVGPTRQDGATKAILAMASNGTPSLYSLNTARAGAALLVEDKFGMVLAGGSSEGVGLERMTNFKSGEFVKLPYPADPVTGAALVMEDDTHLLRLGGLTPDGTGAPTVRINVECSENCVYETVPALDVALRNAQSFYDDATGQTLVVGEDASGVTEVYRYSGGTLSPIEIPQGQRRVRALALELPNQQLALIGGTDPEDEGKARSALSVIAF